MKRKSPVVRFLSKDVVPYFRNRNKKPLLTQIRESFRLYREYRFIPYHYFMSSLYTRGAPRDILRYVPPRIIALRQYSLNALRASDYAKKNIANKARFAQLMQESGLRCVETLGATDAEGRLVAEDGTPLEPASLRALAARYGGRVFAKPRNGSGGDGVQILDLKEGDTLALDGLRDYILQPFIAQHPQMNALFPNCINTIRIDTFFDDDVLVNNAAVVRIGKGEAVADNWSLGAIAVGIDLATGQLMQTGWRHNKFADPSGYEVHPDTGTRFLGHQVPFWQETKALVSAAAAVVRPLRSVGWDVAITPEGPMLIEANVLWSVNLMQTACGGLRDTPIGRYALREHGLATT